MRIPIIYSETELAFSSLLPNPNSPRELRPFIRAMSRTAKARSSHRVRIVRTPDAKRPAFVTFLYRVIPLAEHKTGLRRV